MTASPFLPGRGFSEYAVRRQAQGIEVRQYSWPRAGPVADLAGSARCSASPSTGRTWAAT